MNVLYNSSKIGGKDAFCNNWSYRLQRYLVVALAKVQRSHRVGIFFAGGDEFIVF
jgi:hypothetical protein